MSTRRGFLVSTLAAVSVPLAARASMLGQAPVVRVITESICTDTLSFARHFGIHSKTTVDPAELLFDLEHEIKHSEVNLIFGLTRASTQFLIEQTAIPHGYQTTYRGEHRYAEEGLTHSLSGSRESIDILAERLSINSSPWTSALADTVGILDGSRAPAQHHELTLTSAIPHDSSRHLVSWLLRSHT